MFIYLLWTHKGLEVALVINRLKDPLHLSGKKVVLDEIQPKYFPYVIAWRNNPDLNKFLNQPFKLTMELEKKWYEEKYLLDDTQGLMVMIDKVTNEPFGTIGWANLDLKEKCCTGERLILGRHEFRTSATFFESFIVLADYLYKFVDVFYGHVVVENSPAIRLNNLYGFKENVGAIKYPEKLLVNGLVQREYYRTKEMYDKARENVVNKILLVFDEE